jgi:predicted amidophosphoribosyltransferase
MLIVLFKSLFKGSLAAWPLLRAAGRALLRGMPSLVDSAARLGHAALDVFFPPHCVACGALAPRVFCRACAARIVRRRGAEGASEGVRTLVEYDGPITLAIRRAKYCPDEAVARALGRFLVDELAQSPLVTEGLSGIAWVPAHWRRRFMRRFDLPQVLAGAVSRALALPRVPALRSTTWAPPRAGGARDDSLVGRYAVARDVREQTLLLVDDVVTTGATLDAAAMALEEAGATVHRFALAFTPKRL